MRSIPQFEPFGWQIGLFHNLRLVYNLRMFRLNWRWNVRTKLLAFAAIVLTPVVIVAYLTAQSYISATRTQILSSTAATTSAAVASVEDFLNASERLLLVLASNHAIQSNDRIATEQLFAQTLAVSSEFLSFYLLDANGQVQASVPGPPPNPSEMRYGLEAFQRSGLAVSGRMKASGDGERVTAIVAVPVRRGSQIVGALGAEIAMQQLRRGVANAVMRAHAVVLIFDHDGQVLVAPDAPYYADDLRWKALPALQTALRGNTSTIEYSNPLDARPWLGTCAPIRRTGWVVLVSYPSDEVFAPLREVTLTAALSLGSVVLFAILLAFWLAARFTRPVQQVQATALAIAQGEYDKRVRQTNSPTDEIGQMAVAFNQMADALQQHMVALMNAQREIEMKAQQLQQLLERSVAVQEAERQRIAQDIHDGITQMLVGCIYEVQAAKQALQHNGTNDHVARKLDEALALVSDSVSEIRRVIFDLHPTILDELGLVPALKRLSEATNTTDLQCALNVEGAPQRLPATHELALYRIAQEALNNVRKHAQAQHVQLRLHFDAQRVTLAISDDGRGLPPNLSDLHVVRIGDKQAQHLGLIGMRERAQNVGGTFALESRAGSGASVTVSVPYASVT